MKLQASNFKKYHSVLQIVYFGNIPKSVYLVYLFFLFLDGIRKFSISKRNYRLFCRIFWFSFMADNFIETSNLNQIYFFRIYDFA